MTKREPDTATPTKNSDTPSGDTSGGTSGNTSREASEKKNPPQASGFLGWVEKVGNKLPDPFWLFVIIGGIVLVSSWIGNLIGMSATDPETGDLVEIKNLLSAEGLSEIVSLSLIHI